MRSYVGAYHCRDTDQIMVWERDGSGRHLRRLPAPRYFFVPDVNGNHRAIDGTTLTRIDFDDESSMQRAAQEYTRSYGVLYESDIPSLFKALMDNYYDKGTPELNFAFWDIEVNYSSSIGFAGPSNPYAIINAVTVYQSWAKKYVTVVVPPIVNGVRWKGTTADLYAKFDELVEKGQLRRDQRPEFIIVANEAELLIKFVELIQDADIISGWNSEFFDLPYCIRRLQLVLPKLVNKLCFIGTRAPRERQVEKFGSPEIVYSLYGRTHLDYKDLFQKFTFEGRESYALGNILAAEVGMSKVHYEGTLEQLYHNDFPLFCCYNFRDVSGMVDLDAKFKFVQLVNQMAHENTCLFENILGTVRYVETGIANRAHHVHNMRVPDKRIQTDGKKVEGALVMTPRVGLHEYVGSVDINSLYPNVMRSLNISPEMFIGQFCSDEIDWRGIMTGDEAQHTLVDRTGDSFTASGAEWLEILKTQKWAISAYGTVFDQSKGPGLVPDTIGFWFAERKRLQAEKKKWGAEASRLEKLIKEKGSDPETEALLAHAEKQEDHYDLLQLTKKIQLNSTYGALLNAAFRFGRKEMGASVTACGRQITTHMMETIHSILEPDNPQKIDKRIEVDKDGEVVNIYTIGGDTVIYGDTDSCYFKTHAANTEEAIEVADLVADLTNKSFPAFMQKTFNCQEGFEGLIKAGREVVARRGLFQARKKYILKVVDLEGKRVDKLKSQGSEIKKSDTPKVIQDFMKQLMGLVLDGAEYPALEKFVNEARRAHVTKTDELFLVGVVKQVNNLDSLYAEWQRTEKIGAGKVTLTGQARAAINFNELQKQFDPGGKLIRAGDKVRIFYLKPNHFNFKSIGVPAELEDFPAWFPEDIVVDTKLTEEKLIDNKLKGIFAALGQPLPNPARALANKMLVF